VVDPELIDKQIENLRIDIDAILSRPSDENNELEDGTLSNLYTFYFE